MKTGDPFDSNDARVSDDLREEIVRVCLRMVELGINQGTAGNLSVRLGERFLITPSGIPYDELRPDQIALMDDDAHYAGPCIPSTEWRLHREILRRRRETNVVVHTHSNYSTAVACLRRDLPAVHYYIVAGGGPTVRCAEYATYGSQALADNAVAALRGRSACLLANHGMIVLGTTLQKTLKATFDLETVARQYIYASQIGEPVVLPDDEIERVRLKMATYGDPSAHDAQLVRVDFREI